MDIILVISNYKKLLLILIAVSSTLPLIEQEIVEIKNISAQQVKVIVRYIWLMSLV